jgi:hypothetical protein
MPEVWQTGSQALCYPAGIPLRPEKVGTLVVVNPMNGKSLIVKIGHNFRTGQPGRTGYENHFPLFMNTHRLLSPDCR